MYPNYNRWIDFEIDTAVTMGKPIIGIRPWGQMSIPVKIRENSDLMVGWDSDSILKAIRQYAI